jgi:hypothetical protein
MTLRKKAKTKFQLLLRRVGFLCKKPFPPKKGVRISRTCMPDGSVIEHGGFVEEAPLNNQSFESELHIYHEIKNSVNYTQPKKNNTK